MREQIFNTTDIIGYSTDSGSVIDTTLHNVMDMLGFFPKGPEVTQPLCVGFDEESDGIHIQTIYNDDTGEVYWENGMEDWSEADETLIDNLLMWGELE